MGHRQRRFKAFTLVEVLIVIVILGILAAVAVPKFTSASTDAQLKTLTNLLSSMRGQIQVYKSQHNETYPTFASFVNQITLASKSDGTTAAVGTAGYDLGPYLQSIPNNPYTSTNTVGTGAVGSSAWYYDEISGIFRANNAASYTGY